MKISLSIERDEEQTLSIECSVQGLPEKEAKERWADLMSSVGRFLSQARREESETLPIRHGVFF
jgi:hypothetical protein